MITYEYIMKQHCLVLMYYEMSYGRNENVVSLSAPATSTPSFPLQLWTKRDVYVLMSAYRMLSKWAEETDQLDLRRI